MLDEDSNALTIPPKSPTGMAELCTSSSSSGSRRSCRRHHRHHRSFFSSPKARRNCRRYHLPAPQSGFSLPSQLFFLPWYWLKGVVPPLLHCPRLLQPTASPTPLPPATIPITLLRQEVAVAMQVAFLLRRLHCHL